MNNLPNLATHEPCSEMNESVKEELMLANIPVFTLPGRMDTEVKTQYIGMLNGFVFSRAWRYWVCEGDMPLDKANELYSKYKDLEIRAGGHCGNVEPKTMSHNPVYDAELKTVRESTRDLQEYMLRAKDIIDDETLPRFVDMYHIDTQLGLNKLAQFIKDNNIVTDNPRISKD